MSIVGYYALEETGAAFDADYQAVLDEGTSQGYTLPSGAQQILQNDMVVTLKASGAWALMDIFYIFANDGSFDFGKLNWKAPTTFYPSSTGTPAFASNQGFIGGATNGTRLDTGYQPSVFLGNYVVNDCSFGMWIFDLGTDTDFLSGDFARNLLKQNGGTTRINSAVSTSITTPTAGFMSLDRGIMGNFDANDDGVITNYNANGSTLDDNTFNLLNRATSNVGADATMSMFFAGASGISEDVRAAIDTYMTAI